MFIRKNFTAGQIFQFSWRPALSITVWSVVGLLIYQYTPIHEFPIPWLPLSLVGTAVAFYVGFKNNSAYDRMWEARKIWGAIVNSSRAWGSAVKGFVTDQFAEKTVGEDELKKVHIRLIYRHIAWLYALRSQLLVITPWEHAAQGGKTGRQAARYRKLFGVGLIDDDITKAELHEFLPKEEYERLVASVNTATQIIDTQAQDLKELRAKGLIDDFRHMELQKVLYDFYVHQGKAERIKKFPLPRQYGAISRIFVNIFLFLLPIGMASVFDLAFAGDDRITAWASLPFTILVGWVYQMMENVGDYSENPFQGMGNDIPMLSLCRVIEIDLRQMLGETDLPPSIEAKNDVLM